MKKRAIIYGRVSTVKQSSESIETQIAECEKWARENDCMIVDIYDDSGQSGRAYNVDNRSGFQQIKEDAKAGRMNYALIHKIDRFARSVLDYFQQEAELAKYGVQIIVVSMPYLQNADIVSKSVHIAMAEQFSVNLSNEVLSKMRTFARKGAFLGGKPPYGFNVVETETGKKLAINETEAAGIRLMYDLYLQDYGYVEISKMLHKKGHFNAKGNPFTASHIRKILSSKKYNGYYVFGVRETINGKEAVTNNPDNIIEFPGYCDKIIEDDIFNAVQNKLNSNVVRNKRRVRYYPFTGITTCGICGRAITGYCSVKPDGNKKAYAYYRCTGKKILGCKLPAVRADYLEDYILEKIKTRLFDKVFTDHLVEEIKKHLSIDVGSFVKDKAETEKKLATVRKKIEAAADDKYSHRISRDIYEGLVQRYENEKTTLENHLYDIETQINFQDKSAEITDYVKDLKKNLENANEDIKYSFLKQCVKSIVITPEKAVVSLFLATPPTRRKLYGNRLSNIAVGVPLCIIDGKSKVYTDNGLSLISFEIAPLNQFNSAIQ